MVTEEQEPPRGSGRFEVHLDVFEGPFDLLLGLIAKHKLDVTEVALSKVTDEFIAYISAHEAKWDLEQATHFLVVAATLLDLKAARLLPTGDVEDEEDLELLEERDLLFARLLQYRAYKEVAGVLAGHMAEQSRRFPRDAGPDPYFAGLRPDIRLSVTPEQFAAIAARALTPKREPTVSVEHIYTPLADVTEQGSILVDRLRRAGEVTFQSLIADCAGTYEVVARFLAVLELYRDGAVGFEQVTPFGELHVRWVGAEGDVRVGDDYSGHPDADPGRAGHAPQPHDQRPDAYTEDIGGADE